MCAAARFPLFDEVSIDYNFFTWFVQMTGKMILWMLKFYPKIGNSSKKIPIFAENKLDAPQTFDI